eukprot:jgi/Psemu1/55401/gm1.55401_g
MTKHSEYDGGLKHIVLPSMTPATKHITAGDFVFIYKMSEEGSFRKVVRNHILAVNVSTCKSVIRVHFRTSFECEKSMKPTSPRICDT